MEAPQQESRTNHEDRAKRYFGGDQASPDAAAAQRIRIAAAPRAERLNRIDTGGSPRWQGARDDRSQNTNADREALHGSIGYYLVCSG